MGVAATHPEYNQYSGRWEIVKDVINSNVKKYIKPVEDENEITESMGKARYDRELSNYRARNKRYVDDAQFTNFTARTKNALVGAIFRKPLITDLPGSIEYLNEDATGSGVPLNELAQEVAGEVIETGRYGLMVDYPASEQQKTIGTEEKLNLKARITCYGPQSIINWRVKIENGIPKLSMVMLKECIPAVGEDGYTWISKTQYRELRLENGVYSQYLFDQDEKPISEFQPKDKRGQTFDYIPFSFVGSENNDPKVDSLPLFDIAMLNIGHLRNSADFEEMIHICASPTMCISTEMSPQEFEAANPGGVRIGARRGFNFGPNSRAEFLQPQANQVIDVAMQRKETQAAMIGARIMMATAINETAEAARMRLSGETCQLALISKNVGKALEDCAKNVLRFMDANPDQDVTIELNKDFFEMSLDSATLLAKLQLYINGIIAKSDLRNMLRENGDLDPDRTDDDIEADIQETSDAVDPLSDEV